MDFQLRRRHPVTQLVQYRMHSNPNYVDAPELKVTLRELALQLPGKLNPRTREMMALWRRETPDDVALIQRILRYFNQEDFHYSMESPLLGRNAVDDFLFNTRTGYCEHYASAFAVMMRLAGIPSRIVTGYQGGWYSELGNYLLVRQSDAHAWVEVWLPGRGWTRVDPTAAVSPLRVAQGSRGALAAPRHWLDFDWIRSVRNGFDLVEQRWNDWVIEFNAQNQARLFSFVGLSYLSPAGLVFVLFALLGVMSLFLLPLILRSFGPGGRDPTRQAWEKFLRRLKRAGFQHRESDGAMELACAAADALPANSAEIYHIADLYNRLRYSPEPPGMEEIQTAVSDFHPSKRADDVR